MNALRKGLRAAAVVVALFLAASGSACEDGPKAAPGGAVSTSGDPEPAAEPEPATPGGPVLEVLDPGGDPKVSLSWSHDLGAARTLTLALALRVATEPAPGSQADTPEARPPARSLPVRLVVAAEVVEGAGKDGAPEWAFAVRTLDVLASPEGVLSARQRGPQGPLGRIARIRGRRDLDGDLARFDEPGPEGSLLAQAQSAVRRAVAYLDPPAPTGPVGLGARWRVRDGEDETNFELVPGSEGRAQVRIVPRVGDRDPDLVLHAADGAPDGTQSDRFHLEGVAQQGGLLFGRTRPGSRVRRGRRRLPVSEDGRFLLGLGKDARTPTVLRIEYPDGLMSLHTLAVRPRTFPDEAIDGLPERMVHPPKEERRRLKKVNAEIDRLRRKASLVYLAEEGFIWPARGKVTSTYGRRRILNGVDKGFHWGVDIGAPVGRKVVAPARGVVIFARKNVPLAGNLVILDHGLGLTSSFLHLSRVSVKEGQEVERGQVIGRVGKSGRATGPHLDWRMNHLDVRIDPQLLVEGTPSGAPNP